MKTCGDHRRRGVPEKPQHVTIAFVDAFISNSSISLQTDFVVGTSESIEVGFAAFATFETFAAASWNFVTTGADAVTSNARPLSLAAVGLAEADIG